MRPLIVVDEAEIASVTIGKFLDEKKFNILRCDESIVELNCIKDRNEEIFIIASPHASVKEIPTLTAHTPGNFGKAEFGGVDRRLSISPAVLVSEAVRKLKEIRDAHGLEYEVSLEVTHHGPSFDKPIVFVEVGSTEKQWRDEKAAKAVAEAIKHIYKIAEKKKSFEEEVYIGIGGTHYAPNFTKLVLQGYNIGHIIPKYMIEQLDEEIFEEMVKKTLPMPKGVIVDWKGTPAEYREKAVELGREFGLKVLKCIGSKVKEVQ